MIGNSVSNWTPAPGPDTEALLDHYKDDDSSTDQLLCDAIRVLSRCVPPDKPSGSQTGLVIGYVQSGKTRSFTTVTALARDNGYRLVIIITGTSKPLTEQSTERLRSDLQLGSRLARKWLFLENPRENDGFEPIRSVLSDWKDENVAPNLRRTVLIGVMKHHSHLQHLTNLLQKLTLDDVPCLIIDDEGDQASLNTNVGTGHESTTYSRILQLRSMLRHHSYLQYTATPQAPLLINTIDVLSPGFAEVLEPGEGYVGGEDVFNNQDRVLRTIPEHEIYSDRNLPHEPPESLLQALRVYFVGVAVGTLVDDERGNRTMLVHPSRRTATHSVFKRWIDDLKYNWEIALGSEEDEQGINQLVADFRTAYDDLSVMAKNIPNFDEILTQLQRALRITNVKEMNSSNGKTPIVDWGNSYAHILIGGQAMNRGFTVEGLTVTYMPRSIGAGNADTIQQRARFFGYKKSYLSYCRIFIAKKLRDVYSRYVEHERSVRSELVKFQETGRPLADWRRQFLMLSGHPPTRANVIDVKYLQDSFSNRWYIPATPHFSPTATNSNREVAECFADSLTWIPNTKHHAKTEIQRHMHDEEVSLLLVYESFLMCLRFSDLAFTGVLLQIRSHLDNNLDTTCTVVRMSSDLELWRVRTRRLDADDKIVNLMQGPDPDSSGKKYPGDRNIGDKSRVIVQIHKLNLTKDEDTVAEDVVNIAIWIPSELATSWLIQDQNPVAF